MKIFINLSFITHQKYTMYYYYYYNYYDFYYYFIIIIIIIIVVICFRNGKSLICLMYTDLVVVLRLRCYLILEGSPICSMTKKSLLLSHLKDIVLHYSISFKWNKIGQVHALAPCVGRAGFLSLGVSSDYARPSQGRFSVSWSKLRLCSAITGQVFCLLE